MLAAAEYLASSSSHRRERERGGWRERERERERRDIPIWMDREPRSFRDSRFQISFGFANAEDFSLLVPSASPLPPLLPRNMARPLSDFPHRVLSCLVLASRPVTRTLPGLRRFSPTVLRFFCMRFSETFLLFFWGFSRRVSFTNERRLCGLFQRKRRHTTKREHNSTLTEAEERRGQSRNFLRAFIYPAAQPSRPLPAK